MNSLALSHPSTLVMQRQDRQARTSRSPRPAAVEDAATQVPMPYIRQNLCSDTILRPWALRRGGPQPFPRPCRPCSLGFPSNRRQARVLPGRAGRIGRMSGAKEHGGKNEAAVRKDIQDASPHHIGREHRCPHSPVAAVAWIRRPRNRTRVFFSSNGSG